MTAMMVMMKMMSILTSISLLPALSIHMFLTFTTRVQMRARAWHHLDELFAGTCDGMTYEEIEQQ